MHLSLCVSNTAKSTLIGSRGKRWGAGHVSQTLRFGQPSASLGGCQPPCEYSSKNAQPTPIAAPNPRAASQMVMKLESVPERGAHLFGRFS